MKLNKLTKLIKYDDILRHKTLKIYYDRYYKNYNKFLFKLQIYTVWYITSTIDNIYSSTFEYGEYIYLGCYPSLNLVDHSYVHVFTYIDIKNNKLGEKEFFIISETNLLKCINDKESDLKIYPVNLFEEDINKYLTLLRLNLNKFK